METEAKSAFSCAGFCVVIELVPLSIRFLEPAGIHHFLCPLGNGALGNFHFIRNFRAVGYAIRDQLHKHFQGLRGFVRNADFTGRPVGDYMPFVAAGPLLECFGKA